MRKLLLADLRLRILRLPVRSDWSGSEEELSALRAGLQKARQNNLAARARENRRLAVRRHTFSHFHLEIYPMEILLEGPGWRMLEAGQQVVVKGNERIRDGQPVMTGE